MWYRNAVTGWDGSPYSAAAVEEACRMAAAHDGTVTLVHCVYYDAEEFGLAMEHHEKRIEAAHRQLEGMARDAAGRFGIPVASLVREGEPQRMMVQTAVDLKADLIVMGTYGRKGVRRLVMGSVTSDVIIDAPCDVLVVKSPCRRCESRFRSVLVPYDGSERSVRSLRRASDLPLSPEGNLTALYVVPRYQEMVGFFTTDKIRERLREEASAILEGARLQLGHRANGMRLISDEGHVGDRIVDSVRRLETDLVVMGSHGWRGVNRAIMGSTADWVIASSPAPVLVAR